jgi:alkylation response protein AidB-like acyl-CoA dehydrogenase
MVAPDRPLGTQQVGQHGIAESRAEIDSARLMAYQAAWKIDREGARAGRSAQVRPRSHDSEEVPH